ncbi:MAG: TonB-dependent receptor plug domain-containing protein, partial [Bacteroidales bacterium]
MNLKKTINWERLFLLSLVILMCISVFDMSAQHKISLSYKDTSLKIVLKEITAQTGYDFIYSDDFIEMNGNVTLSFHFLDESIENILKMVFKNKGISFEIKNKKVMLAPMRIAPVKGQQSTGVQINGVIKDELGEPLPGAAVRNIVANKIVAADLDGRYLIQAKEGDELIFSSIGMRDQKVIVGVNDHVNVVLSTDLIALEDVVVTGYQTLSKERATGAFAKVSSHKLLEHRLNNLSTLLDGQVAGFNKGVIRGAATMKGVDAPLYVIDGFPVENTRYSRTGGNLIENLPDLNLEDIESITVLKDAAATSIYGARAMAGVIVVT